jgi:hypothetical protein
MAVVYLFCFYGKLSPWETKFKLFLIYTRQKCTKADKCKQLVVFLTYKFEIK